MQKNEFNSVLKRSLTTRFDLTTSSVIRNTFALLSMTILFSAITAYLAMLTNASMINCGLLIIMEFALIFLIQKYRNSAFGILWLFAFTGLLGYSLGPILNWVIKGYTRGGEIVITTLGLTGSIFLGLAFYVNSTRQNFNYLKGFLFAGTIGVLITSLIAIVFNLQINTLIFPTVIALLSSGWMLFDISRIIHNEENNYIIATLNLYINIFNLFISLLQIIMSFNNKRD